MITIYSSTGCIRCRIVKDFLRTQQKEFVEYDIKTEEGNAAFKAFYRANRAHIRRDDEGIFFPIVQDEETIVQDAGPTLARLISREGLGGVILPNNLGHGWTGGLRVADFPDGINEDFLRVVTLLKRGGLMTEVRTAGNNSRLLRELLSRQLVDRLLFEVRVKDADGTPVAEEALARSLSAVAAHPEIDTRFVVDLGNLQEGDAPPAPAAVGRLAEKLRSYLDRGTFPCTVMNSADATLNLLPYRTAVRRWFVRAEAA